MMTMMIPMIPGTMTVTVVTISPSGREFPQRNLPARKVFSLSVVSVVKRRRKTSTKWLPGKIRSQGVSTPKGVPGAPKAHQTRPRGPALGGRPGSPLAALLAPPVISDETSFSDFS